MNHNPNQSDRPTGRREFIKKGAAGAAGLSLAMSARSYGRIIGANERVRVGIVGFSGRFRSSLLPAFMKHAEAQNFELVAVSDIWNRRRDEAQAHLQEQYGKKIAASRNNDELYDTQQLDAVIISTADFQHALHCAEAVNQAKMPT